MYREVVEKSRLLDDKGYLEAKGFARKMKFVYNREQVRSFPLKLKEWNFYQLCNQAQLLFCEVQAYR